MLSAPRTHRNYYWITGRNLNSWEKLRHITGRNCDTLDTFVWTHCVFQFLPGIGWDFCEMKFLPVWENLGHTHTDILLQHLFRLCHMLHYQYIVVSVHFPPNLEFFGLNSFEKPCFTEKFVLKKKILYHLGMPLRRLTLSEKNQNRVLR